MPIKYTEIKNNPSLDFDIQGSKTITLMITDIPPNVSLLKFDGKEVKTTQVDGKIVIVYTIKEIKENEFTSEITSEDNTKLGAIGFKGVKPEKGIQITYADFIKEDMVKISISDDLIKALNVEKDLPPLVFKITEVPDANTSIKFNKVEGKVGAENGKLVVSSDIARGVKQAIDSKKNAFELTAVYGVDKKTTINFNWNKPKPKEAIEIGSSSGRKDEEDEFSAFITSLQKPSPEKAKINSNSKWVVIYDFDINDLSYYKIEGDTQKLKNIVRPIVKRNLQLQVVNYNPYTDSLAVVSGFKQRNLELQQTFLQSSALPSPSSTNLTSNTDNIAAHASSVSIDLFKTLAEDIEAYVFLLKNARGLTYDKSIEGIALVNKVLTAKLGEAIYDYNSLQQTGLNLVSQLDTDMQDKAKEYLTRAITAYKKLLNPTEIKFDAIQIKNADATTLTISRYSEGKKVGSDNPFEFSNQGGFKIDFSTGFIADRLLNKNYALKTVTAYDTTLYIDNFVPTDSILAIDTLEKQQIIRDEKGNFTIGVGLFSHFYIRTGSNLNVAFTLGMGLDNNLLSKYVVGLTLLLGEDQRAAFTFGATFGQVKRLASGLSVGDYYEQPTGQVSTVPTKDVWKSSIAFGLSYNFGGVSP